MSLDMAALEAMGLDSGDSERIWRHLSKQVLTPGHPFADHERLFAEVYAGWDATRGPAPAWMPSAEEVSSTNLARWMDGRDYAEVHAWSVQEPEAFWSAMLDALGIQPRDAPSCILAGEGSDARWLPGAKLNIVESCFAGRDPDRIAVMWADDGGAVQRVTVHELDARTARVARALRSSGFGPGDAFGIDMPMTVDSVVIYLGIVRMGGVVVSIADSFAAEEIATRLHIAEAVGIFTQDEIHRGERVLPLYARVVAAQAPLAIVLPAADVLNVELRPGDVSWADFLERGGGSDGAFHIADAEAPTNILFSSGTTGTPKAIPWTHITPIKAAADGWAHHDIRAGDVVAWPTNLGWMMGPWLIYASLLNDAAIALFHGTPGGTGFTRFVQDAGVTMLGVVPSLVKAWRSGDCVAGLDWSTIRCFSSTGEASNPSDMLWLMSRAGYKPVIEYCGGTEIGGGYITGSMVQPQAPATFSTPALGTALVIIDEQGERTENGELALVAPMLGSSNRLLNRDHHAVYFADMPPGPNGAVLRRHGDQMEHLGGGYYRAHGRVDDTMNLGGIKVSSAEIERVCNTVEAIAETAAVAVTPAGGGPSRLVIFAVLTPDSTPVASLRADLQASIRAHLNPLFKVHDVVCIDALPRTASNKVMRRVLRAQYAG